MRALEAIEDFPHGLLARLKAAKEDCDILAQRFFRQNDLAFMNQGDRIAMIAWCEKRVELFQALTDEVERSSRRSRNATESRSSGSIGRWSSRSGRAELGARWPSPIR